MGSTGTDAAIPASRWDPCGQISACIADSAILYRIVRYTPADEVFPTDRPLPAKEMIGRGDEAFDLARELSNGMNRLIAGPRRMGKTTLCRAALDLVRAEGQYVASLDLFEFTEPARLAEALVDRVIANRSGTARAKHAVAKGGRRVASMAALTPVARMKADLGEEFSLALEPALRKRDPVGALGNAFRAAQRVCEIDNQRLVILIDEFQELGAPRNPFGDPERVTKAMRAALQDCDRITTLFTGSLEHMMRDLFGPAQRAFYRWGGWHELWPIDAATWRAGILDRYLANGLRPADGAVERIVDLGEGHVRSTMLIAKQAYLTAITLGEPTISPTVAEVALEMAMAADAPFHDAVVEDLRSGGREVLVTAERVARGEPPYKDRSRASTAQRALRVLGKKGVADKTAPAGRGGWRIIDPLLRRYLARR